MVKINRRKCKTCVYRARKMDLHNCDYILIEKKRRGCPADKCDKYIKGARREMDRNFYLGD